MDSTPVRDDSSDLSIEARSEIDTICDQFEAEWTNSLKSDKNVRPSLEQFSQRSPFRDALLRELLFIELAYRRNLGERPTREEYSAKGIQIGEAAWQSLLPGQSHSDEDALRQESFQQPESDGSLDSDRKHGNFDLPNEKIGRYEVIRHIGTGGFGSVYLAHDPQLNREVAVKVPHLHRFVTRLEY